MNKQQIENLRVAYSLMVGIPAVRIHMGLYRADGNGFVGRVSKNDARFISECGSAGCMAGWLSAHPYFKSQGLTWDADNIRGIDPSTTLFGVSNMFRSGLSELAGKREALERIRRALHDVGAIDDRRYYELQKKEKKMTS